MYFWTIQSNIVIKSLLDNNSYYPNFNLTSNSCASSNMRPLYPTLLNLYNKVNHTNYEGLLFGFGNSERLTINSEKDLYDYFVNNPAVSIAFNFWNTDYCILKIQVDEDINVLPIDFNDFIKLVVVKTKNTDFIKMWGITQREVNNIVYNFKNGIVDSLFPSFTQIHYSHIDKNNIKGIYPLIDYKTNSLFSLTPEAMELKNIIE